MSFTGKENHEIALADARAQVQAYRDNPDPASIPMVKSVFFGRDAITTLLNLPKCVGIRAYFARSKDDGRLTLVLAGEDGDGLIIPGVFQNFAPPCPPICPGSPDPLEP